VTERSVYALAAPHNTQPRSTPHTPEPTG